MIKGLGFPFDPQPSIISIQICGQILLVVEIFIQAYTNYTLCGTLSHCLFPKSMANQPEIVLWLGSIAAGQH